TYGDRALEVVDIARAKDLHAPLVEGHPHIAAEAAYCVTAEMVVHLDDLLARRTRLALTDRGAGVGPGSIATELVAAALGWTVPERDAEVAAHRAMIERERGQPIATAPERI
ncbi:MAG TPA: glycerol-3-phosphate dehydrogenase C-terminal domain-containing protein, partial [Actinomycetota bacterium]|nr:glycerol-3-phosphate dehydrogenase C-terminal domain-containing protein [Actinomycetota bacterium]